MNQPIIEPFFPPCVVILSYVATSILVLIFILLLILNSKISVLSAKLSRTRRTKRSSSFATSENEHESQVQHESIQGTHFEEFLNADPERHKLTKKEQSKAFRAWRREQGLNWSK